MTPGTKNLARRLHVLTESRCRSCSNGSKFRCCADEFCAVVEAGLRATNRVSPPPARTDGPRFLGPEGCVLAPELRPLCTGYVCDQYRDRAWKRLERRFMAIPEIRKLTRFAEGAQVSQ